MRRITRVRPLGRGRFIPRGCHRHRLHPRFNERSDFSEFFVAQHPAVAQTLVFGQRIFPVVTIVRAGLPPRTDLHDCGHTCRHEHPEEQTAEQERLHDFPCHRRESRRQSMASRGPPTHDPSPSEPRQYGRCGVAGSSKDFAGCPTGITPGADATVAVFCRFEASLVTGRFCGFCRKTAAPASPLTDGKRV